MRLYRVTIDTLREQYVYEVEADNKSGAVQAALALAFGDGLDRHVHRFAKTERLDS